MSMPTQTLGADIEGSGVEHPTRVPGTDAPDDVTPPQRNSEFQFTTEQIEKARREEREKVQREKARLKERMDAQTAELEELRKFREEQERQRLAEERKQQKKQKTEDEKDLSAKELLMRREQEWEQRLADQERRFEQMEAQSRLEREVMRLQVYIQRRVAEEQTAGNIAPQFIDYISGTSEEEVEAAIELARNKTAEILAEVTNQRRNQQPRGVSVSAGPSAIGSQSEMPTDETDFTNMTLHDYMTKVRPKLNIGGGGQGLFS